MGSSKSGIVDLQQKLLVLNIKLKLQFTYTRSAELVYIRQYQNFPLLLISKTCTVTYSNCPRFCWQSLGIFLLNLAKKWNANKWWMLKYPLLILGSTLSQYYNVNVRHIMTRSVRFSKIRGLQHGGCKKIRSTDVGQRFVQLIPLLAFFLIFQLFQKYFRTY